MPLRRIALWGLAFEFYSNLRETNCLFPCLFLVDYQLVYSKQACGTLGA